MPNYVRARIPGATYFFTVKLSDPRLALLTDRIDDLRAAYVATAREAPITCDAMVVLPDHLHAVWTLPPGDSDFPERWRRIKARFSHRIGRHMPRSPSKRGKRECGLWQRRFWEHVIRDEADYHNHIAYCWGNPVKHGLVTRAVDWPYSSLHRDIRLSRAGAEWAGHEIDGDFGE